MSDCHPFLGPVARLLLSALTALLLAGCDPGVRHQVLTTLFDGVPARLEASPTAQPGPSSGAEGSTQRNEPPRATSSSHQPYADKECDACHNFNVAGGLRFARNRLCFECHPDLVDGPQVHGPVSVGECLSCHEPHATSTPALLRLPPDKICGKCHLEERLTPGMHQAVAERRMVCSDCHDPHAGVVRYFLK